ncbi:MAG: TIGR00730 family Rossman fold protein [Christensenellales bacterium]
MDYICVYASSSDTVDKKYFKEAEDMALGMAREGYGLVFGAGTVGLMGAMARGIHAAGGRMIGVIPEKLNRKGIVYERCDKLIVTKTMRERKAVMEDNSIGFITLPGGFGTFEEVLEIITLKQLGYHNKPIVIMNASGYYDSLINQFNICVDGGFANESNLDYFKIAHSTREALDYFKNYTPSKIEAKWAGYEEEALE